MVSFKSSNGALTVKLWLRGIGVVAIGFGIGLTGILSPYGPNFHSNFKGAFANIAASKIFQELGVVLIAIGLVLFVASCIEKSKED